MTSSSLLRIAHCNVSSHVSSCLGWGCPDSWWEFWMHLGRCFKKRLAFESVYQVKTCPPQCGIIRSTEDLNKNTVEGWISSPSSRVGMTIFFCPWTRSFRFSGFWIWGLDTRGPLVLIIRPDFLVLQFAESRLWVKDAQLPQREASWLKETTQSLLPSSQRTPHGVCKWKDERVPWASFSDSTALKKRNSALARSV